MGKNYDQLDLDDRYRVYRLHQADLSLYPIGYLMGRSPSTISTELRRNALPRDEYKTRAKPNSVIPIAVYFDAIIFHKFTKQSSSKIRSYRMHSAPYRRYTMAPDGHNAFR